jgi:hypothetical protein
MILRVIMAILSAGWLWPMWIAASMFLQWLARDEPAVSQGGTPPDSFPYLNASGEAFTVACIWLAVVIIFWAGQFNRVSSRR